MKELSLHILDITENSVRAGATRIELSLIETTDTLTVSIKDNGCGMDAQTLQKLNDPFFTTRTTRNVGLGVPLFRLAAEQTGGSLKITSSISDKNHGTSVVAVFYHSHIDCAPLGDIVSTLLTLIHGSPGIDFIFTHSLPGATVSLDTTTVREVLGNDIPLDTFEVLEWMRSSLLEQYPSSNKNLHI